ncbi:hypothetical protein [Mycolicibacterium peregrinum]|nr:hypothetical protein [Mycolicibacterium peregrinum]
MASFAAVEAAASEGWDTPHSYRTGYPIGAAGAVRISNVQG